MNDETSETLNLGQAVSNTLSVHYSQKSDIWRTPPDLYARLNEEFGPFNLDVAASDDNALCERYFTEEQDALIQDWGAGVCFCNPPYSKLYPFVAKAYEESLKGATVVMLIPSRTDTRAFHQFIFGKAEIRFLKGRLRFSNAPHPAPFPSCVVIMRPPPMATTDVPEASSEPPFDS